MSNRLQSLFLNTTIRSYRLIPPHFTFRVWFCSGRFRNQTDMKSEGSCEAVVGDAELLDQKMAAIRNSGPAKLQVIADFDATLSKYWVNGSRGQSSHGLLQQENREYNNKRWRKTHALLIEGGLTYDGIRQSVANSTIAFREGVVELFEKNDNVEDSIDS